MMTVALANAFPALLAQALTTTLPQFADYMRILPELLLSIFGMIVMIVDPLLDEERSHKSLGMIALIGALAALLSTALMARYPGTAFWSMVRVEGFSIFFHFLVIAIAAIVILTSDEYMAVQRIRAGEYYALILFGTVGIYPIGTLVRLSSNRLAVVVDQTETSLLTPRVKVFFSIDSDRRLAPKLIDLSDSQADDEIVAHEDPADWQIGDLAFLWSGIDGQIA